MSREPAKLRFPAIRTKILGVDVIRGYAPLNDLAVISRADVYDAKTNPTGTQRDLSPKHAREAYLYIQTQEKAYWPEIFLCARNPAVVHFEHWPSADGVHGMLIINIESIRNSDKISISRVDGNHRLHFASGEFDGFPAVTKPVSFCLAIGLSLEDEMKIFRDINNNQRRMNTSHLANIEVRLTQDGHLKYRDPKLYITDKLSKDSRSPFKDIVYSGGRKDINKFIPLKSLQSGIEYMFSQPTRLSAFEDPDLQFAVLCNYFLALKKWEPECWSNPRSYLMLRGAGFWGVCFLAAEVIDRGLKKGHYKVDDLYDILMSGKRWDWSLNGDFAGFSGRGGAIKIRDRIVSEIADENSVSLTSLMKQISNEI
jgi:DGQHR domain-containing protein